MKFFRYTTGEGYNILVNLDQLVKIEHKPAEFIILHFTNGMQSEFRPRQTESHLAQSRHYYELLKLFKLETSELEAKAKQNLKTTTGLMARVF